MKAVILLIFEEKTITLKNGQQAVLKTPELKDAQQLLFNIRTAAAETDFLSRTAQDWQDATVESEEKWIRNNRESEHDLVLACYIDSMIVGTSEITFLHSSKTSHRAVLGIAIQKDFWNLGIGSAMFEILLEAAARHKGTEIAELEFISGNNRGKALYEKFGFRVVSVKPNVFKLQDGSYQDMYYMQKVLKEGSR